MITVIISIPGTPFRVPVHVLATKQAYGVARIQVTPCPPGSGTAWINADRVCSPAEEPKP